MINKGRISRKVRSSHCLRGNAGESFAEEDYCEAVTAVQQSMDKYEPSVIGCEWDNKNPRIQLEPRGERGYIEQKAVKRG